MQQVEVVYNGRDNHIELELHDSGINLVNYSELNRVVVTIGSAVIDSDINPEWLDFSGNRVVIKAGLAGLALGSYRARIDTFDIDHENGIVWTESLAIVVRA